MEKGNGENESKLMQGPRDTYSPLLRNAMDCLVPEESLPSSLLLLDDAQETAKSGAIYAE